MADLVAVRAAIVRMGLSQAAAQYATDEMGLSTLDAWRDFHTDDDLDGLAKNLRSPGGQFQMADGTIVRHPGFPVSVLAISNLKVMRLALKHHQHIQRDVAPAAIDLAWIETWEFLVDFAKETAKKYDEEDLPKINMKDWPKTKEKIINHFSEVYGKDGIPLAYILRDEADVPPEAEDPQDNYDGDFIKELIARAPHDGASFRADNRTVCRLLKKMCADTTAYIYVSKYSADGRQAWLDLMQAYLGPQHVDIQASIYEAKLQKSRYTGDSSRFRFESYIDIHQTAHERLANLERHGYKGMDEGTKIRLFLNGIHADKLKTTVEVVRGNKDFKKFTDVSRRLMDTVVLNRKADLDSQSGGERNQKQPRNISSVKVMGKDGKEVFPDVQPDMSTDDKYYAPKEWAKLSQSQKKGVLVKRQKRKAAGISGGKKQNPQKDKDNESTKKLQKQVAKLQRQVASLTVQDADASSSDSSDDEEPPTKKSKKNSNRKLLRR